MSMHELLEQLKIWRAAQAEREGVPLFRILSNQALFDIASVRPQTKKELLMIKGIKGKKCERYGTALLALMWENPERSLFSVTAPEPVGEETENKTLTVSAYLVLLNRHLVSCAARIRGEVSSADIRDNYLFFGVRDKNGEALINCFMWRRDYLVSGIELEEGMEIVVEGVPEIYARSGRLSFRARSIELVGEGALKQAYDKLKAKLEHEGLFAPERKRPIPEFPQHIGVITSRTGAVIHDFLNNIGRFGFHISLLDTRVEGARAVPELIHALRQFRTHDHKLDTLVLIRGGGSLESLVAFNSEALVREIVRFPVPVICGIGHDKDVPLVSLACDRAASTPTAVTKMLNESWERASARLTLAERDLINSYGGMLLHRRTVIDRTTRVLEGCFAAILNRFGDARRRMRESTVELAQHHRINGVRLTERTSELYARAGRSFAEVREIIMRHERALVAASPARQLRLGYSILIRDGVVIRSIRQIATGDRLDARVADGIIRTTVSGVE
ncbi:MAG: exodeoxyribonuclease VII large subunit [bacterium]|nr:exodeoxyribonuclease VII large subunit [bacterium]MDZ4299539.1 exodeoxyribonuclease VII large subunit [Candidatus Sungbacteria bacterium]